mmetsp:Transcript_11445/g.32939  ORF Transcript_11445/g.32939 Transcript_11445/m.32939 type:complete len:365 (+) Transcript_11445:85-1179(+)|eukprot:CAMPEP_0172373514 /NCGR_PEP_ID=MMETSP1060-20121228/51944_1 /TAXON_ID=37318 /ORGANISM="Pseudo-nitzschia pungens, Strain cf. cingulata" /LENGTH=364 /DNA_ID=CAMNT_0013099867 /DNA_START=85 /DNA_END=1179 /DNA_ORIENTATION=-
MMMHIGVYKIITVLLISIAVLNSVLYSFRVQDVVLKEGATESQFQGMFRAPAVISHESNIIVMVMGQKDYFPTWLHRLEKMNARLTFIFASYDEEIREDDEMVTSFTGSLDFYNMYIPNTRWEEGRTLLGEKAIEFEVRRGKQFDWWFFLDDDVNIICEAPLSTKAVDCWQHVFDTLNRNDLASKITAVNVPSVRILPDGKPPQRMKAANNYDPNFAAFKREYLPYVQPYAVTPQDTGIWMSNVLVMCQMRECMPRSAYWPPHIMLENPSHRPYKRGFQFDKLLYMLKVNFGGHLDHCVEMSKKGEEYDVGFFVTPWADSMEELQALIPDQQLNKPSCASLVERFERWEIGVKQRMYNREMSPG